MPRNTRSKFARSRRRASERYGFIVVVGVVEDGLSLRHDCECSIKLLTNQNLVKTAQFAAMSSSVLKALKAAHEEKLINSPVAVIVGGTAGIGAALAVKVAQYSTSPTVHLVGRSKSSADGVISQMKEVNPKGDYHFHECDVSLLSNSRNLATSLSGSLPKVNLLIVSQGILSMQGRTETSEGLDIKMSLHYYSRMLFIRTLLPNLLKAVESGEEARVMSVLDSVRGSLKKLNWDDLDLKKNYSLGSAAAHCITMTDVAVHRFARLYPTVSFQHAYPAFVNTSIGRNLPWYLSGPAHLLGNVFGTTPADCAEQLYEGLVQDSMKTGAWGTATRGTFN
ncbi:hypothetical protein ONZ45_g16324 [Pleurotus djamor]|nr:hypothetical protein ONZ45_g16324 [Pleurotus djamor]